MPTLGDSFVNCPTLVFCVMFHEKVDIRDRILNRQDLSARDDMEPGGSTAGAQPKVAEAAGRRH